MWRYSLIGILLWETAHLWQNSVCARKIFFLVITYFSSFCFPQMKALVLNSVKSASLPCQCIQQTELSVPIDKFMERWVNFIHHKVQINYLGQQIERSQGNVSSVYIECETKACHCFQKKQNCLGFRIVEWPAWNCSCLFNSNLVLFLI